jgi:CelD/BcsL family acetyltransferase involved in cellulose biosynthesis
MKVTLLDNVPSECDELAGESPDTTFYHTRLWLDTVAAAHANMSVACFVAEDAGAVAGFLPFFFVRTGPFRRAWSLPFGTYGGPVVRAGSDAQSALLTRFRALPSVRDVIEAGWTDYGNIGTEAQWRTLAQQTHIVDLEEGFDNIWNEKLGRDKQQRSRRAERLGVKVFRSRDPRDLDAHYEIYLERMRAFGTRIVHPRLLFQKLFAEGGERVRLYVARCEDVVVGAHFNFCHRGEMIAWFGMTNARGEGLQAGTLLYTEIMRDACRDGLVRYNLGGSLCRESLVAYKESLGGRSCSYAIRYRRSIAGHVGAALVRLGRRS